MPRSMFEKLRVVHGLHRSGKLDRKLRIRLAIFFLLTLAFFGILSYDLLFRSFPLPPVLVIVLASFLFGFFALARMNPVVWDEEREVLSAGRMDALGFVALGAYILMRLGARWFLEHLHYAAVTFSLFTVASVFGIMVGRFLGTVYEIHRTHSASRD